METVSLVPATDAPRFALEPFRALRLANSYVGDPVANRVLARPYRSVPGRLREWRRKRHLELDPDPALYVHEYTSHGVTVRRSEERRVGKEWVSTCRSRWSPNH